MLVVTFASAKDAKTVLDSLAKSQTLEGNALKTWERDQEDGSFTHTGHAEGEVARFKNKACIMPPKETAQQCKFSVSVDKSLSDGDKADIAAVYHGRFMQMLLAHFERHIIKIEYSRWQPEGKK